MPLRVAAERGITLIWLSLVVGLLVGLAAIVVPLAGSSKRQAEAARILQLTDALRVACERYRADTGQLGVEVSGATARSAHALSLRQPAKGWNGPYLARPLTSSDNPFGGAIRVYETLGALGDFDLDGRGRAVATGAGNCVRFAKVPLEVAQLVDTALDRGVDGDWAAKGRVKWSAEGLDVFLLEFGPR
jgi:type II secretory pathway pseudopilin PulG